MSTLHSRAEFVQWKLIAKLNTPYKGTSDWLKPDFWEIETMGCTFEEQSDILCDKVTKLPILSTSVRLLCGLFLSASLLSLEQFAPEMIGPNGTWVVRAEVTDLSANGLPADAVSEPGLTEVSRSGSLTQSPGGTHRHSLYKGDLGSIPGIT